MSTAFIVSIISAALLAGGALELIGSKKAAKPFFAVALAGLVFGALARPEVLELWTNQEMESTQAKAQPYVDAVTEALLPTTTTIPK